MISSRRSMRRLLLGDYKPLIIRSVLMRREHHDRKGQ
nr:MAG TPA: hypothetical protein [Caudoviricetes sp.]